ncbi:hypothetical protein THAOC_10604 [Thalassiosira oceanica]|uniref:RING-type domain-containing protein n=1 Tax=Thalassiosira oceanica TaxID=159749 RepID=K0SPM9_THAOC|nr:hypothetical protein THAOC_10604 [Thalassiosira oceanica]|eukprot:EJK68238.1 hypothetical protein THAOC_10604 [Thalassiosira oceanica]
MLYRTSSSRVCAPRVWHSRDRKTDNILKAQAVLQCSFPEFGGPRPPTYAEHERSNLGNYITTSHNTKRGACGVWSVGGTEGHGRWDISATVTTVLSRPPCFSPRPPRLPLLPPCVGARSARPVIIPSASCSGEVKMDGTDGTNECGICLGEWTDPVELPCGHTFCADCLHGWKSKYAFGYRKDQQRGRRCPLCRGTIPPSQEEISSIKMTQFVMKKTDKSDPSYEGYARKVKQFEAEYGEDWEGTAIEYDGYVNLPFYVFEATKGGNFRTTTLQWLGKGNVKDRVNAKCECVGNMGLLFLAAVYKEYDLMKFLLLNGADVNAMNSDGSSVLSAICSNMTYNPTTISILLSWGAELFVYGRRITNQQMKLIVDTFIMEGDIANLISSELGGRRCKVVSTPNTRDDLVGKTCMVGEYIKKSGQIFRRVQEQQAHPSRLQVQRRVSGFRASLVADDGGFEEVDPEAEAKAERAAADLLAELGLDDLKNPSSNAPKKGAQSAPTAGKKKKRGGKKKGRK